jgi:hypothetical protein
MRGVDEAQDICQATEHRIKSVGLCGKEGSTSQSRRITATNNETDAFSMKNDRWSIAVTSSYYQDR